MARYANTITDANGVPLIGVEIYVYEGQDPDLTLASLTDDDAQPLANPVVSDDYGNFYFNADDGVYRLSYHYQGKERLIDEAVEVGVGLPLPDAVLLALSGSGGSSLVGFLQSGTGAVARSAQAKMRDFVNAADFGVTDATSAAFNQFKIQSAADEGFAQIFIPDFETTLSAQIELKVDGQRLVGLGANSRLVKSDPTINRLVYADALTDVGIDGLYVDGAGQSESDFSDSRWAVFFRNCTRPFVTNSVVVGALTDNIVFELCTDPKCVGNTSNDSKKGGIYFSSCDGGICADNIVENNGGTSIGNGIVISCSWGLRVIANTARNNQQGQCILSRGNRSLQFIGNIWGDPLQTRGDYSIYTIGETTTGTVHGITYDGVTKYGTEKSQFTGESAFLPPALNFLTTSDFFGLTVESLLNDQQHCLIMGKTDRVRFRGGHFTTAYSGAHGVELDDFGDGGTTNLLLEGVDMNLNGGSRVHVGSGSHTYLDQTPFNDGVPLGNTAIADVSVTATSGSLPTPNGSVTIANAATPTNAELLEFIMEERAKNNTLRSQLRAAGLLAT